MTITIGNSNLPGVLTTVESGGSMSVQSDAPADPGLIGQANLQEGTASANETYAITSPITARRLFGGNSQLTDQIEDALGEGAQPVFAVAPEASDVTDEEIDDNQLDNVPAPEDASKVNFKTSTGDVVESRITFGDPANSPSEDGVAYYNPITGKTQPIGTSSDTGVPTVSYKKYDYTRAIEVLAEQRGDDVDFVAPLTEAEGPVQDAHDTVRRMEQRYQLAMVKAVAPNTLDASVSDQSENPSDDSVQANTNFDSSRMQQVYPAREADGTLVLGGYVGRSSALGIDASMMGKRLYTQKDLMVTLSQPEKETLANNQIVPLGDESRGARVVTDATMVSDDNKGESSMRDALSRLVIDYVIDIENANSERYIGEFNNRNTRDALRDAIAQELNKLYQSKVLESYTLRAFEIDATTCGLELGIDTVDPLRNIDATITAGEVVDVADQASATVSRGFAE